METYTKTPEVILVVDDEAGIRETLAKAFQRAIPDAKILLAPDAREALRLLATERVDLIVSDHRMPGMSGMEFLERAYDIAPGVPRIMITAYPNVDLALRGTNAAHLSRFLAKPFPLELAMSTARELLDARRSALQREAAMRRAMDVADALKAGR